MARRSPTVVGGLLIALALAGSGGTVPAASSVDPRDGALAWRVHQGPNFERMWGIEIVGVRLVSSNWMLQFKYRVTDPEKAKGLLSRHAKPYLVDQASGAKLAVPAMENIGELRQVSAPEEGRTYYIIFGNANKIVLRGNRVSIEIGSFHADEMIVE